MSYDPREQKAKINSDIEREIRAERKFSLADAIGRMAGPGAMKGVSPVTLQRQAEAELQAYLNQHLTDRGGVLAGLILRYVTQGDLLLQHLDQPLVALDGHVQRALASDYRLKELVREADAEWGRTVGERPYFDREGQSPHPDDPYTAESVRAVLSQLAESLRNNHP